MRKLLFALSALALCAPASAKLQPWDGPTHRVGQGGSRQTVGGIDIWTAGEPARGYTILGVATVVGMQPSNWVGPVKRMGGDAAIVLGTDSRLYNGQLMVIRYDRIGPELAPENRNPQ